MESVPHMVLKAREQSQSKVNIESGLKDELEKWLNTENAFRLGYRSQAQFVTEATREKLEKLKSAPDKGTHFILPNLKDSRLSLDVDIFMDRISCNICNTDSCIHVKTLYNDREVRKQLKQHNVKMPKQNQ